MRRALPVTGVDLVLKKDLQRPAIVLHLECDHGRFGRRNHDCSVMILRRASVVNQLEPVENPALNTFV